MGFSFLSAVTPSQACASVSILYTSEVIKTHDAHSQRPTHTSYILKYQQDTEVGGGGHRI
jgi:hypothetical protein